jgi:hypothetical protein
MVFSERVGENENRVDGLHKEFTNVLRMPGLK